MERSPKRPAEKQLGFDLPETTEPTTKPANKSSDSSSSTKLSKSIPPPFTDADFPHDLEITPLAAEPENSILYNWEILMDTIVVDDVHRDVIAAFYAAQRYIYLRLDLILNPPTGMLPRIADEAFLKGEVVGRVQECRQTLYDLGQDEVVYQVDLEILKRFQRPHYK